jgi:spore coat protein JB
VQNSFVRIDWSKSPGRNEESGKQGCSSISTSLRTSSSIYQSLGTHEGFDDGDDFSGIIPAVLWPRTVGGLSMHREQLEMLKNLQALQFTALEFNLYLDTHPGDQRALQEYECWAKEVAEYQKMYEACYGPLTALSSIDNQGCWRWLESPWPWEIEY